MAGVNAFIGIPWVQGGHDKTGADCWGLVLMVLEEAYGVRVGRYAGAKAEGGDLSHIIESEVSDAAWVECGPIDGAVVVMVSKRSGRPEHVGVYVAGSGVLHSINTGVNGHSSISPLRVIKRLFKELRFYRYAHDCN